MTPRTEAMVDEYEEVWRRAALVGRAQFYGRRAGSPGTGVATCAWLAAGWRLRLTLGSIIQPVRWRCPEDGYRSGSLADVMIHLNNDHRWSWDRLANKFRNALTEGEIA